MQMFDEMKELSETPSHWIMPLNLFVALVSNRFPQLGAISDNGNPGSHRGDACFPCRDKCQCVVTSGQQH